MGRCDENFPVVRHGRPVFGAVGHGFNFVFPVGFTKGKRSEIVGGNVGSGPFHAVSADPLRRVSWHPVGAGQSIAGVKNAFDVPSSIAINRIPRAVVSFSLITVLGVVGSDHFQDSVSELVTDTVGDHAAHSLHNRGIRGLLWVYFPVWRKRSERLVPNIAGEANGLPVGFGVTGRADREFKGGVIGIHR